MVYIIGAHQNERPSFVKNGKPSKIVRVRVSAEVERDFINAANDYFRAYRTDDLSILVTREWGKWHVSIAHQGNPPRYPTWDEIAEVRYRLISNEVTMAMLLPPLEDYVNIHENCFHLHEIDYPDIPA